MERHLADHPAPLQPGRRDSGRGLAVRSRSYHPELLLFAKSADESGPDLGVGPAFLLPTATDHISTNQWGAGITGVALIQRHGWTFGGLAHHMWSLTGDEEDGDISATFLQPFVSFTTPKAASFTLNTESTYDWENEEWSVPINATVGQIVKVSGVPIQFTLGARYWAQSPEGGPKNWGARFQVTLLFPK